MRDHHKRALDIHREVDNRRLEGWTLVQLAHLDAATGDLPAATAHLDTAEPLLRDIADPTLLARHLAVRAEVRHLSGQPDAARSSLNEAVATAPPDTPDAAAAIARARALLDGEE